MDNGCIYERGLLSEGAFEAQSGQDSSASAIPILCAWCRQENGQQKIPSSAGPGYHMVDSEVPK